MGTYDIRLRGNGPYSGHGNEYDANRLAQDLVKTLQENGHDVTEARFVADGGGEDNLLTADYTRFAGPAPTADTKRKPTPLEEATALAPEQKEEEARLRAAGPIPRVPVAPQDATAGQGQPSAAGQTAGTVQPAGGGRTTQPGQRTASGPTQPVPQPENKAEATRAAPGVGKPSARGPAIQGPAAAPAPAAVDEVTQPSAPPGVVRESPATSDKPPADKG